MKELKPKGRLAKAVATGLAVLSLSGLNSIIAFADVSADIANSAVNTVDGETYYISGKTPESSLNNISCIGGNVRIVLDNVDMNLSDWVEAISINSGANVNLVLRGENKITSGWGIIVTYGSTLNISGDGSLQVHARNSSAIGNINYDSRGMGSINIQSGTLELTSENGCGIGAAVSDDGINKVGDIIISGGNVKASGSSECAGIGSVNSSSLGNVYIGGDSVVEASSVLGAGIGTGADTSNSDIDRELGDIVITDEASVNAVSYSGAGIGTGDNQDKVANITINKSATVKAESHLANSIGDGISSNTSSNIKIADGTSLELYSYKGETLPIEASANVVELKMDTASDEGLTVKDTEIPAGCYSVTVSASKASELEDSLVVHAEAEENGKVKKIVSIKKRSEPTKTIYVASNGSDYYNGKTPERPVKTFQKAYKLVENGGKIIVNTGAVEIDRVPRLDKSVTVECNEGGCLLVNTDEIKAYDDLKLDGATCEISGKNKLSSKLQLKNSILKLRKDGILKKPYLNCRFGAFNLLAGNWWRA